MNKRVMAGLMASLLVFEACPTTSWAGVLAEGSQEMTPAATIMANLENENAELVASEKETVEAVVEETPEATPAPEATAESVEEEKVDEPVAEMAAEAASVEEAPAAEIVETEPQAEGVLYVSNTGDDENNDGSAVKPFASLAKAAEVANATAGDVTIELQSDLLASKCARFYKKGSKVTINGNGYTVTRADKFAPLSDDARSWYNPAMIEIDGDICLNHIVLDDAEMTAGSRYAQATTDGTGGNTDTVQDSIVAAYDGGDKIVLGSGTVLKNFGGMSAVRLSGGDLIMESGSRIEGSKKFTTTGNTSTDKDHPNATGVAGAIWVQGGNATVDAGAEISSVNGRAIYVDSGAAIVNGAISGIAANNFIWQGNSGTCVHVRNNGKVTLNGTFNGVAGTTLVEVSTNGAFVANENSLIRGGGVAVHTSGANDGRENLLINGEITGITGGQALSLQMDKGVYTIGEAGNIHGNTVGRASVYLFAGKLHHKGKINRNYSSDKSGGIEVNNNTWSELVMYPGAEVCNNYGKEHGAGVMVCNGRFEMLGGIISGNIGGSEGAGVNVRRGGQFVMRDGEISNNTSASTGGGVALATNEYVDNEHCVELLGGTIKDNVMRAAITPISDPSNANFPGTVTGGESNNLAIYDGAGDLSHYFLISKDMNVDEEVWMKGDQLTTLGREVKMGLAKPETMTAFNGYLKKQGLKDAFANFWAQSDDGSSVIVRMAKDDKFDSSKPVFLLTQPTDENGNAIGDYVLSAAKVDNGAVIFDLPSTGDGGMTVALAQPDETHGTLALTSQFTEIKQNDSANPYNLSFDLVFTPQGNETAIEKVEVAIEQEGVTGKTIELTKQENGTYTGTWTGTLDRGHFIPDADLTVIARATITAHNAETFPVLGSASIAMVPFTTYTVTYTDGLSGTVFENQTYEVIENRATPAFQGTLERTGYVFDGWNPALSSTVTADTTYVAQWRPAVFTVTYQYEGTVPEGASALPEPQRVAFGETYTVAPNATAPGYTFSGWTLSGDQVMGASDVVLTGSFTANPVTPEPEPENPGNGNETGGNEGDRRPIYNIYVQNPAPNTPAAPAAPVVPATGGVAPAAPTTVEDDATPLAEAAEETAAPEAVAETISDDGTPLARTPESRYFPYWIWVLGAALTAIYGCLVARSRKNDDANSSASA